LRQVVQDLGSGETSLVEVPVPRPGPGEVLVRTRRSLVSAGTERMLVDFGKASMIGKAMRQPERVRTVLAKARTDGVFETFQAVRSKLDEPVAMGYCNVGLVEALGEGVDGLLVGDRVASNGPHAEFVRVPVNLCARVPDGITDEAAAFTVLGSIGLQGVRLSEPSLGECFVVTGLGLLGLLTAQILRANGCRVLGIDLDSDKVAIARGLGMEAVDLRCGEDPEDAALRFSRGRGVDAVLITAATSSNEPVRQAARICRVRGRIVLVGVAGLELDRSEFFRKELTFQVSCSYGPGRYDPEYEVRGHDYPVGYVRWTEQRNFEAFIDLLAEHRIDTGTLVTHRFPFDDAGRAYELLRDGHETYLGIVLEYGHESPRGQGSTIELSRAPVRAPGMGARPSAGGEPRTGLGFIGAGNYAGRVLIPAFAEAGAELRVIANLGGVSGGHYARRFGFNRLSTDPAEVLDASDVDAVVITTRHDSHASYVIDALERGKHVFCEKPLAMTRSELKGIETAHALASRRFGHRVLCVGFNRRFAPLVRVLKTGLEASDAPVSLVLTCNAGAIPSDSWVHHPQEGGGRIVGEACHFVDLARHLADSSIIGSEIRSLREAGGCGDTASIALSFENGSIATVHYFANGSKSYPKERFLAFQSGRIFELDNFRRLVGHGVSVRRRPWRQDKGQRALARAFLSAIGGAASDPMPFPEIIEVSETVIALVEGVDGRAETG
jgi:predicted dehydrogenase/threonine dehydrogenase-like Zn-dependent dehydrogenase